MDLVNLVMLRVLDAVQMKLITRAEVQMYSHAVICIQKYYIKNWSVKKTEYTNNLRKYWTNFVKSSNLGTILPYTWKLEFTKVAAGWYKISIEKS